MQPLHRMVLVRFLAGWLGGWLGMRVKVAVLGAAAEGQAGALPGL